MTPIHLGYAAHLLKIAPCVARRLEDSKLGLSKEVVGAISDAIDVYESRLLEKDAILMEAFSPTYKLPSGPHVYMLIEGDEIIYVGQTVSLTSRIASHKYATKKSFSFLYIQPCEASDLVILESLYINKFKPVLNQLKATRPTIIKQIHSTLSDYLT
jgi:hypothetical protein